jgi:hypothetical protein
MARPVAVPLTAATSSVTKQLATRNGRRRWPLRRRARDVCSAGLLIVTNGTHADMMTTPRSGPTASDTTSRRVIGVVRTHIGLMAVAIPFCGARTAAEAPLARSLLAPTIARAVASWPVAPAYVRAGVGPPALRSRRARPGGLVGRPPGRHRQPGHPLRVTGNRIGRGSRRLPGPLRLSCYLVGAVRSAVPGDPAASSPCRSRPRCLTLRRAPPALPRRHPVSSATSNR